MSYDRFAAAIESGRLRAVTHPMYGSLASVSDLHVFMDHHVFAVWDFMSLLTRLQAALTCVAVPWVPPTVDTAVVRYVNEIVVGEESDVVDGRPVSHVDLYLDAMRDVGANRGTFLRFVAYVRSGRTVGEALTRAGVPDGAAAFVRSTFGIIDSGSLPAVAGAFCGGREQLIPTMFEQLLPQLGDRARRLGTYLARHIEVDGEDHGPAAQRLLETVCGADPQAWSEATQGACAALDARARLWSAVHAASSPFAGHPRPTLHQSAIVPPHIEVTALPA